MVGEANTERKQLWAVVLLTKAPAMAWFALIEFISPMKVKFEPNIWWILLPSCVFSLLLFTMPFVWQGSLNCRNISRRIFRHSDRVSLFLAIIPTLVWAIALTIFTSKSSHPFSLHFPTRLFSRSEVQLQTLLSVFLNSTSGLLGILLICNASKFANRVKFLVFSFALGILPITLNYFLLKYRLGFELVGPTQNYFSPWPEVIEQAGILIVILGLMQRGRSSVLSIAVFLGAYWAFQVFGLYEDIPSMVIGLFGGGAIILIVNYLQQHQTQLLPRFEGYGHGSQNPPSN
jgi:hypothetical protein